MVLSHLKIIGSFFSQMSLGGLVYSNIYIFLKSKIFRILPLTLESQGFVYSNEREGDSVFSITWESSSGEIRLTLNIHLNIFRANLNSVFPMALIVSH